MPERFSTQEIAESWGGIWQQASTPPDLSARFQTILHNVVLDAGLPRPRPGVRRINTTLVGDGTRTVYGLGVWRDAVNGDLLLIASGSKLQTMPINGGAASDMTTSYPSGFRSSPTGARTIFTQLGGQVYIVNGTDENVKYNGTDLTRMGIVAPASLSAPTKSAGGITGTRQYIATLVSDTAHKSAESAGTPALSVTYSTEQGSFSSPSVPSSDPQVDRWNLYATPTTGGSTFFRVNTNPETLATAIVDNFSDIDLAASLSTLDPSAGVVPDGNFSLLTAHQGTLVGVTADDPNTLKWSGLGLDLGGIFFQPESWPAVNTLPFGEQGGTKITALVSFFEWLLVFQDFGAWSIRGTLSDSSDRVVAPLLVAPDNTGVGVSDQGNVASAENKVLFAAKDGIYQVSREIISGDVPDLSVLRVSDNVDALYKKIDFDKGGVSLYDRDERRYIFFGAGRDGNLR